MEKEEQPPLSFHLLEVLPRFLKSRSTGTSARARAQQRCGELLAAVPHSHHGMCEPELALGSL